MSQSNVFIKCTVSDTLVRAMNVDVDVCDLRHYLSKGNRFCYILENQISFATNDLLQDGVYELTGHWLVNWNTFDVQLIFRISLGPASLFRAISALTLENMNLKTRNNELELDVQLYKSTKEFITQSEALSRDS